MIPKEKFAKLKKIIEELREVIIAFSGGIDSSFLAFIAYDVLKEKATAITINNPQLSSKELEEAREIAEEIGIRHIIIDGKNLDYSWFKHNPPDRCYICKKSTIETIFQFCKDNNINGQLIEGSNFDDLDDYRPGFQAVKEYKVRSPLMEAELTKDEIRTLAKDLGISCWDKPASPCLATRFFFGEEITEQKLRMVEKSEEYLKNYGLTQIRVRVHGELARIESLPEEFPVILENADAITKKLKEFGFKFISLDINGYKKGSMNKAVDS